MNQDKTQKKPAMTEREMMGDSLSTQKMMAAAYNTYAGECANSGLRTTFLSILDDEHDIGAMVYDEMSARGWQKVKPAEQTEILKTKQKFSISS